ncbi:hypothetical protein ISN45_Aa08g019130, partial [Arabidopsis thaliana x Arabidopsis arenosa]
SASYVPTARSNNNHDMLVPRFRPEETTHTISLDIGVGIASSSPDHTPNEHPQRQRTRTEFIQQTQTNGAAGFRFVHGPPRGPYYGVNHQYNGSRETANEAQTGDISSSYSYSY